MDVVSEESTGEAQWSVAVFYESDAQELEQPLVVERRGGKLFVAAEIG